MKHLITLLLLVPALSAAQLMPRPPRELPAADPSWSLQQHSSQLELLPALRTRLSAPDPQGRVRPQQLRAAAADEASIGDGQYGLVFNHAMQSYGALSGEIAFRVRPGQSAEALAQLAGLDALQSLGQGGRHVARVRSPQALRDSLQRLRAQPGVVEAQWVVIYGLPRRDIDNARRALR